MRWTKGGRYSAQSKGTANEPLSKLLPGVSNSSGFRIPGGHKSPKFVVLYFSGRDLDWPDDLDLYTGGFDYYGDNKRPGSELHDTDKKGNFLLKTVFAQIHSGDVDYSDRGLITPSIVSEYLNKNFPV